MWSLVLQIVFNSKNEFYSIQSAWDLIQQPWLACIFTLQAAAIRHSEAEAGLWKVWGWYLLTVVVRELPWTGSNSFWKLCSLRTRGGNRKCPLTASWPSCEIKLSDTETPPNPMLFFSAPQVLYSWNTSPWGSLVLQIPACFCSFVCSALLLILQRDGEVVRWLSKDIWKTGWCCISLFCPTFCRNSPLQCMYAQAAAFLGASCLSDHHSNWCFWYSLSCHFLSYWCCCTVSMKQWHCLDLQSP